MKTIAITYLSFVIVFSLIAFLYYGWDKRQSKFDAWRTPESRLHWLAFLGGWPGALIGQNVFRHKTQKLRFKLLTWLAGLLHLAAITAFCYFWLTR